MASTASTGADARGDAAVRALVDLYERQHAMYVEVRALAEKQVAAVRGGESLSDVHELLTRKRTMLDMIRHMEAHHEEARGYWERHRHELGGALPARLQECLRRVGDVIEEILALENESDRLFLAAAGM